MEILIEDVVAAIQGLGVAGIWIVVVVLALVAFIKQFKDADGMQIIQGNALLVVGFAIGFVSAVLAYMYNQVPPVDGDWYAWFSWALLGVVYGVLIGVLPSGVYELLLREKSLGIDKIEVFKFDGSGNEIEE